MPAKKDISLLFTKEEGRQNTLRAMIQWPVSRVLRRASAKHIAEHRKPLVVFAFDHIAHNINLKGVYEGKELDTFFDWIKQYNQEIFAGVALDIGANIGNHSLYFSDYFKKVYSFEPNPRTYQVLRLNAVLASHIKCFEVGLSDINKQSQMDVNPTNSGGATVTDCGSEHAHTITLKSLDSIIGDDEDIKLIKIDVEGHELKALIGAERVIRKNQPIILFEQHPHDFSDGHSKVVDLLRNYGYRKFAVIEESPKLTKNLGYVAGHILAVISGLVSGVTTQIILKEKFEQDFYPFIIAIPDWLDLN